MSTNSNSMFKLFDKDNMNRISYPNLKHTCMEVNYSLSDDELHAMIDDFDSDLDGFVTYDDFCRMMSKSCRNDRNE